ncbi:30S ribosomal protein S7 [Mucisphaera calidilacus]|uniref:Small ribosomal subunit protein uS7 n=1 Tax=Mucisphaera calidilacus TaxID=2527982 RepID=A0A518BXM9_9BACT|nr:30S ribosomal protein S7 [Mucisphaera calidilacus]QDU71737.1 30S ribosomal protein S7 [Mucisphaera calidilacus]
MGRFTASETQLRPDPRFGDKVLSRFINCIMLDGKKAVAQRIVYGAFEEIEKRTKGEPTAIEVFHKALTNVKPNVEVRSKRVGGSNYQVPMQVNRKRQQSLAFRWLIEAARSGSGSPMHIRLGRELFDAARGEGSAVNKRDQVHRMADANKAFSHFAW